MRSSPENLEAATMQAKRDFDDLTVAVANLCSKLRGEVMFLKEHVRVDADVHQLVALCDELSTSKDFLADFHEPFLSVLTEKVDKLEERVRACSVFEKDCRIDVKILNKTVDTSIRGCPDQWLERRRKRNTPLVLGATCEKWAQGWRLRVIATPSSAPSTVLCCLGTVGLCTPCQKSKLQQHNRSFFVGL